MHVNTACNTSLIIQLAKKSHTTHDPRGLWLIKWQAHVHHKVSGVACGSIARNSGHFAPVINCQRNLISKMSDKNDRSHGKRIPCDFLNNLSSVDLFYEEKSWNETPCKKVLGLYSAERLIAPKQYAAVPFVTFS